MQSRGPVLTLLSMAALAVVLLAVDATHPAEVATAAAAAPAAAAAAPPTTEPPVAEPVTTEPPGAEPPKAEPPEAEPPLTGSPPAAVIAQGVYAGRTDKHEATIAIAVLDGRAVAYVCDGKKVEAWLEGTLTGDRLELTGPKGAALSATATPGAATGEITVGRKHWTFTARMAGEPAGLYEGRSDVRGVAIRIGWIVLPDGTQVGLRSAEGGEPVPAPALDPAATGSVLLDGAPVQVRAVTGADPVTTP